MISKRVMSDTEIRHRKKIQGHLSQTTGALGLTALGGTLLASKTGGKATKAAFKAVGRTRPSFLKPKRVKSMTTPVLATSAGIGGAGAFNFASYTNAEAKKRRAAMPVAKSIGIDAGYMGEEGFAKAWSPVATNYDPESKRHQRNKVYQGAALAGAGVGAGYAGHQGTMAVKTGKNVRLHRIHSVIPVKGKNEYRMAGNAKNTRLALVPKDLAKPAAHAGKAAAGASVIAAGMYAHKKIKQARGGSWSSYGKRDTVSAFGIDHSNGQRSETEN